MFPRLDQIADPHHSSGQGRRRDFDSVLAVDSKSLRSQDHGYSLEGLHKVFEFLLRNSITDQRARVKERGFVEIIQGLDALQGDVRTRVEKWLQGDYDLETKHQIQKMLRDDPHHLIDAFYTTLSFGTAGLRGIMGPGSNRMNKYTVRAATQGLANYIHGTCSDILEPSVAIGYDSRHNSREFAMSAARVLAGNNIKVFLFEALRPTPLVSFACRYKKCQAAIMVTASHNPPEYNGYKVYWSDGAQVLPPHDIGIIQEVAKITEPSQVRMAPLSSPLIQLIGADVDEAYLQSIQQLELYPQISLKHGNELQILYSNLHGTGITMVPRALALFGFTNVGYVEEQKEPDGNFPTAHSPNPEEDEALKIGIQKLIKEKYDLLIATDPDCDRIGVVVRHQGKAVHLTGSQFAVIAVEAICQQIKKSTKSAFIKSIVTSELFRVVAEAHQGTCFDVLPGFKYIAEKIRTWEEESDGYKYIFGGEESCGFLLGTFTRDKDAVTASCLIAEIALQAKRQGKTLVDLLDALYNQYGYYLEHLVSLKFEESKEGKEAQAKFMNMLRDHPPKSFIGIAVKDLQDFKKQSKFPVSDVLIFVLEDESKIIIRPSGTEPKIKIYLMLKEPIVHSLDQAKEQAAAKAAAIEKELKSF
ncbi:MAG: pgm [Chlamydiia bacterium]|nr:pgm [Chlamydiia bacterium]